MSFPQAQANRSSHSSESGPSSSSRTKHTSSATQPPALGGPSSDVFNHEYVNRNENRRSASSYEQDYTEERVKRRRHQLSYSGGFLLDSINPDSTANAHYQHGFSTSQGGRNHPYSGHRRTVTEGHHREHDRKGKGKARGSIGRSPLGIVVMSPGDSVENEGPEDIVGQGDRARAQPGQTVPSVFGSDQAQIVNLALNLSENRRRQFSAGRLLSADLTNSPRVASAGLLPPATPAIPIVDESLRQRVKQERRGARTSSQGYEGTTYAQNARDSVGASSSEGSSIPPLLPTTLNAVDTSAVYPSEATMLRVEKAKITLELSYEYRRSLQYLPKIPMFQDGRPSTGRASTRQATSASEILGRSYNPLQYIRNRKVRGRERNPLNAEAEGWKNVEAVRGWVDRLANERQRDSSEISADIPLPPFPPAPASSLSSAQSPSVDRLSTGMGSSAKELRPRIDWMSTPWDMLADAYWLEQTGNKYSVEDHNGRRVFSAPRPKAMTHSGLPSDVQLPSSKRSMSIPRSFKGIDGPRKLDAPPESSAKERGRPRHKRLHSFTSGHDYSSSQDRRSGWRRRLIRPNSLSSSEDSGPTTGQRPPKPRDRSSTIQQRQSNLILEKQIMRLIAKEAEAKELDASGEKEDSATFGDSNESDPVQKKRRLLHEDNDRPKFTRPQTPPARRTSRSRASRARTEYLVESEKDKSSSSLHTTGIAINVSPPRSQSRRQTNLSSPSSPEVLSTPPERKGLQNAEAISSYQPQRPVASPSSDDVGSPQSLKTDSSIGHLSPQSAGSFNRLRKNPGRQTKNKDSKDFESRLRGLLKGAKIADIVGNPVSKVGDFIWKQDGGDGDALRSPASTTPDVSDEDDYLQANVNQISQQNLENKRTHGSEPRPELPVFKSPFRSRDNGRVRADTVGLQPSPEIRGIRNSDGIQRAPPPLDIRSISPSPVGSRVPSPEDSQRALSRKSSSDSESLENREKMTIRRRHAIAHNLSSPPKRQQTLYETAVEPQHGQLPQWPARDPLRFINITGRLLLPIETAVGKKDVHCLSILSESAATVSGQILQQIAEVRAHPTEPGASGQQLVTKGKGANAVVQGKILEALTVLTSIRYKNEGMHEMVANLSNNIVPSFVKQLRDIENKISNDLTPIVRTSGNEADRLGSELATTRTLELKRLNDSIDLFIRRKRRRFRLLRRAAYLLLEWTLLGLMWWAWLIVTIIKMVRISVGGFLAAIRWLLWL